MYLQDILCSVLKIRLKLIYQMLLTDWRQH